MLADQLLLCVRLTLVNQRFSLLPDLLSPEVVACDLPSKLRIADGTKS
jgi:hypothetical protein